MKNIVFSLLLAGASSAQGEGMPAQRVVQNKLEGASMVEKPQGTRIDPELRFTDERGYPYQLRQLFPGQRPVVLLLGYYSCPAMCGQVMEAAFRALNEVDLEPGTDYEVLSVSINPRETPAMAMDRKQAYLPKFAKVGAEAGWHVLTGDDANTRALADSVGFQYYWSEHTNQYAHPPALIFLTKSGALSRVIVNTEFGADDVRLAIAEAGEGKVGTFWDQVRLNCLTFDARTNSYSLQAMTIMRVGGALTLVAIAGMVLFLVRKERRRPQPSLV